MGRIPRGTRSLEDTSLFRQPTDDLRIHPDRVTAPIEGYFRIPPVWIGSAPDEGSVITLNQLVHHATVIEKRLDCGIVVRVQRDGTFLFDFSTWTHAPQVTIPGYRVENPHSPYRPPVETQEVEYRSERYAVLRAQVMNVHQACLATCELRLKGRTGAMGLPLTSANTLKGLTFEECAMYRDDIETRSLFRSMVNNRHAIPRERPFARHTLEVEVVEKSLELLDEVLLVEQAVPFIYMIEAVYLAAARLMEGRFGEANTLAWNVCEQLLLRTWEELLEHARDAGRMTNTRRRILRGRDYTSSIMIETLEFTNRIEWRLYRQLQVARKARNQWVHKIQEPTADQVIAAIRAAECLLRMHFGITLTLQISILSPGVPAWNVWVADQKGF